MNQENQEIKLYFKFARTCTTKQYVVKKNWSISYFINHIKNELERDFPEEMASGRQIELVKTMENKEGLAAEDAPAIAYTNYDYTLEDVYWREIQQNQLAFYIRTTVST